MRAHSAVLRWTRIGWLVEVHDLDRRRVERATDSGTAATASHISRRCWSRTECLQAPKLDVKPTGVWRHREREHEVSSSQREPGAARRPFISSIPPTRSPVARAHDHAEGAERVDT